LYPEGPVKLRVNGGDVMKTKMFVLVALAATSGLCFAQTDKPGTASQGQKSPDKAVATADYTLPLNKPLYFQAPRTQVPEGENAWALEVEITGGFVPSRRLVTLTSRGRVTIDDSSGSCSFDVEGGFPEIGRLIAEANQAGWGDLVPQSMPAEACYDCRLKRLSVSGRDADGKPYGHSAYWAEVSLGKLRKEVAAIYSAVEKIKRQCDPAR